MDVIAEGTEPWSYLKFPFIKQLGYPEGLYRVGPLARLNIAGRISTPRAQAAFVEWKAKGDGVRRSSFYYHWARLIEINYALERARELLHDPDICSTDIMVTARPAHPQGVGVIEAPRGTLVHHYWVNESGRIEKVNLIVATGHNNLAMGRGVRQVAEQFVSGAKIQEGALNRVSALVRAYDPCLSCSTHVLGQAAVLLQLRGPDGDLLDEAGTA